MPLALPSGFVDTGQTRYFEASANISLDWRFDFTPAQQLRMGDLPPTWNFAWTGTIGVAPPPACFPDRDGLNASPLRLSLTRPDGLVVTLESHTLACAETTYRIRSATYPYSLRIGPLRLGVRLVVNTSPTPAPIFARHLDYEYAWFVDGYTTRQESCAGQTMPSKYWQAVGSWGDIQDTTVAPVELNGGGLKWEVNVPAGVSDQIRLTGMTVDGATVDTSELNTTVQKGLGGGAIRFDGAGTGGGEAQSPYMLDEACNVRKFGGADLAAVTTDADGNDRTTQWNVSRTRHNVSWATSQPPLGSVRSMAIKASWLAAHDPVLPADDAQPLAYMAPPRNVPNQGYRPVTITLAPTVDVQRPGGVRPSDWVSSDPGQLAVTEGSANTTFEVAQPGATVLRTLFADWEARVGLNGTGDPLFGIEEYERTKHRAGEDIWGWNSYAFLRVRLTAPRDTALILTVTGKSIAVSDPHTTGADRTTNYTVTPTVWTKTYAVNVREGSNEVDLDLLFPNEGPRPFYPDRVTSLRLGGFQTGTYLLTGMELRAKGPVYFKYCWGKQLQGDDYSALVSAVDGAFVWGNVPDQANKADEIGTYGGGARYVQPLVGSGSGIIQDSQYSLGDFINKIEIQEGWTAAYSLAAYQAAMRDPYGVAAAEYAQFMRPLVPYVNLTPGTPYQPECGIVCGRVKFPPGQRFTVVWHYHLWGGLEALVTTPEGERVGDDLKINAVRTDTGATVASGFTDRFGYVVVTPIPANGVREYALQGAE